MRFIKDAGTALAGALLGILVAMLISHLFGREFRPWLAVSLAVGSALGISFKEQWQLSRANGAILVGVLAGVGYVVGVLLSAHA